ncbi:MAG: ABC transporter substrate-binding protein [Candidatus Tectomicrobia bacterium]|nr:ABC transporter substrate-binding protein [Candidatus Tectomicrobia bacterium]
MKRLRGMGILASFLIGASLLLGSAAVRGEPLKIRVAQSVAAPVNIIGLIYMEPSLLKHYGKSYTVDYVLFRGTSPQIQAFAAKELDVGYLAYASLPFAIVKGNLDIKVVADLSQEREGSHSSVWVALEGSGIKSPKDLKGKRIGINLHNTAVSIATQLKLRQYGYEWPRDYQMVEVNFPAQEAFLREKKIDAACLVGPFLFKALKNGGLVQLYDSREPFGEVQTLMTVARSEWMQKNRAAAADFFEDWLRFWRWYQNPANRDAALKLVARALKQPVSNFQDWALTKKGDYYRDPNAMPNVAALKKNIAAMQEVGILKEPFDVAKHVDTSLLQEAMKRLDGK